MNFFFGLISTFLALSLSFFFFFFFFFAFKQLLVLLTQFPVLGYQILFWVTLFVVITDWCMFLCFEHAECSLQCIVTVNETRVHEFKDWFFVVVFSFFSPPLNPHSVHHSFVKKLDASVGYCRWNANFEICLLLNIFDLVAFAFDCFGCRTGVIQLWNCCLITCVLNWCKRNLNLRFVLTLKSKN